MKRKTAEQKTANTSAQSETTQTQQTADNNSFTEESELEQNEPDFPPEFIQKGSADFTEKTISSVDITSEFEKVEKQFYSIPADNYRLIIARCALRVFPLAVVELISNPNSLKAPLPENLIYDILELWRATLMLWAAATDKTNLSGIDVFVNLNDKILHPYQAAQSIAIAAKWQLEKQPENQLQLALEACFSTVNAISNYAETTNESDASIAIDMIEQDLDWLAKHSDGKSDLRAIPLWHDEKFNEDNWRYGFLNPLETQGEVYLPVKQAYQAMLSGSWDGEINPETIIKGSAALRPEDDSPALKDSLGRAALVKALVPRLSDNGDHSHLTIGLLGNWGIGKTSVLRQLQAALDKDIHHQYLFGEFNAWSYEHTGNVQAGLAHEVISALTTANPKWFQLQRWFHKPWVIAKYSIKLHGNKLLLVTALIFIALNTNLVDKMSTLGVTGQAVLGGGSLVALWILFGQLKNLLSQPLAKELKTYLRLPSARQYLGTIPEMKKNIRDLCEICLGPGWWGNNRRLIFFIDDLDRCDVDGIVKTFEAIRLVLDRDWVTVVIAMDQRIALPALACNYKKLSEFHQRDPMSIARDYLGKVIHLPIRLDEPDDLAVAQYLAKIWNDDGFLQQVKTELGQTPSATVSSPRHDETGENKPQVQPPSQQGDREPLEIIIKDIQSVDVKAVFSEADDIPPEEKQIDGFGPQQKDAFYRWLLKFNLRNPRQIKRLYNSFNLLWSIYDESWQRQSDDAWRPHMLGMLVLELINETVKFDAKEDYRGQYRQLIFESTRWKKMVAIDNVDEADVKQSRSVIQKYQKQSGCDLLQRLKPFVLPAVSPYTHGNDSP